MTQRESARARVVSNRFIGSPLKFCSMGDRRGNTVLEYYGAKRERGRTAVVSLKLSVVSEAKVHRRFSIYPPQKAAPTTASGDIRCAPRKSE